MLCYIDVDGVLADFVGGALAFHGKSLPYADTAWDFPQQVGFGDTWAAEFWDPLGEEFWANLQPTVDGTDIMAAAVAAFGERNLRLATSCSRAKGCATGKARWVERYYPQLARHLHLTPDKHELAGPGRLLIDDRNENCDNWEAAGGTALLVPRPWNRGGGRDRHRGEYVRRWLGDLLSSRREAA